MLNIQILCVGKVRDLAINNLIDEYTKRISKYAKITITEVNDEKIPNNSSNLIDCKITEIETDRLIEKISKFPNAKIMFLDLKGKEYTSEEFALQIDKIQTYEASTLIFVIGGSLGLHQKIFEIKGQSICFSKMTFPHQLIRIFLLEQIFRAFKILNNEIYHK